jgi:hypothetical protein
MMAETLIMSMAIGSGLGITIATLEGRSNKEIERSGFQGTTVGFLAGLFLSICCSDS